MQQALLASYNQRQQQQPLYNQKQQQPPNQLQLPQSDPSDRSTNIQLQQQYYQTQPPNYQTQLQPLYYHHHQQQPQPPNQQLPKQQQPPNQPHSFYQFNQRSNLHEPGGYFQGQQSNCLEPGSYSDSSYYLLQGSYFEPHGGNFQPQVSYLQPQGIASQPPRNDHGDVKTNFNWHPGQPTGDAFKQQFANYHALHPPASVPSIPSQPPNLETYKNSSVTSIINTLLK